MQAQEEKCILDIEPVEATFLEEFNKKKENLIWLEKVKEKYGESVDKLSYPGNYFTIERIIDALNTRDRSNEIFSIIDRHLEYYDEYSMGHNVLNNVDIDHEDKLLEYWPVYLYGNDKSGHPVFYDDLLSIDLAETVKIFGKIANGEYDANGEDEDDDDKEIEHNYNDPDKLLSFCCQFRLKFYGKMIKQKENLSKKYGTMIFRHILIMDLNNFSYYKIASNLSIYSRIAKKVLTTEQLLFPQTCHRIYLINAPFTFQFIWKILSNFIDPITLKKIKILGTDYLDEMLNDIDIQNIPKKYGGKGIKEILPSD